MVRRIPRLAVVLGFGMLALSWASPASAQYPQDAAIAGASDTTVSPDQEVTVGGEGWKPGSTVRLRWPSADLGSAAVDGRGEFTTTIKVPRRSRSGESFIRVAGISRNGEDSEISIRLLVEGVPSATGDELSFTPANITLWSLLAVLLLLVGFGAVLRGRRKASHQG